MVLGTKRALCSWYFLSLRLNVLLTIDEKHAPISKLAL